MRRVIPWLFRVAFWVGTLPFVLIFVVCIAALLVKAGLISAWDFDMPVDFTSATVLGMVMFFGSLLMASRLRCSGCNEPALVSRDSEGETVTQPWRFNCAHCGKAL